MARMMSIIPGGGGGDGTIVVPTVGDLPPTGSTGQFALVLSDDTVYIYDGTSWVLVGGQGNLLGHSGSEAILSGAQTVTVVFASAMPNTNYSLTASITNLVDTDPIYLIIVSTTKTTGGFIAQFNAPADSANYLLEWSVSRAV